MAFSQAQMARSCEPIKICAPLDALLHCTSVDAQVMYTNDALCEPYTVLRRCWSDGTETVEIFDSSNNLIGTDIMAFNLIPAPAGGTTCERYTTQPLILDDENAAGITLDDAVALAFAGDTGSLTYPSFGAVAGTDEVVGVQIAQEDGDDVILVNGQETGGMAWAVEGADATTFPGETTIDVPAGCEATITVCFRKCLTKAEIAAL